MQKGAKVAAEPGLFETWWRMRKERKAREAAMRGETPDQRITIPDIAPEIMTDAARLNDPEPAQTDPEVLREFLRGTPHPLALEESEWVCMCGLGPRHEVHDSDSLLDTRAFLDGTGGAREQAARALAARAAERAAQPARGRSESLREFLQRTPHRYESDLNDRASVCVCGLGSFRGIHYPGDVPLLDTHAYITARLEEIRTGWPVPVPEAAAEEIPREPIVAEPAPPSDGVLGYLVACARTDGGVTGVLEGVTHTTPMDLEGARKEAKAHGVSSAREWFPVELRRVAGA